MDSKNGPMLMNTHILQTQNPITERIIRFCLEGPFILPPSTTEPRHTLSQTCKIWRHIILSNPSFWNNILFSPGPMSDIETLIRLAENAFERSNPCLVNLDFVGDPRDFLKKVGNSTTKMEDMVYGRCQLSIMRSMILPNMHRVRALRFMVCTREDFHELLNINGRLYPQLQMLDIALPDILIPDLSASLRRQRTMGLDTFPHVRHFSLRFLGDLPFQPFDMRHLPWGQLTVLGFGSIFVAPNIFTGIMRQTAHSLVLGTFCIRFPRVAHRMLLPNLGFVNMPRLTDLHLNLHNASQDPRLFDVLSLPALRSLQIKVIDEYVTACEITMFMNMITQCTSTLEVLKIVQAPPEVIATSAYPPYIPPSRRLPTPLQTMENFFRRLQNLQTLFLPRGMFLNCLIIDKIGRGELFPRLEMLEVTVTEDWPHIFTMMRQKNSLAEYHLMKPGGSSHTSGHIYAQAFTYVHLFMRQSTFGFGRYTGLIEEIQSLNSQKETISLELLPESVRIYIA